MIVSKLTSKAQTTIPRSVRTALRLELGDELLYQIDWGRVILSKVGHRGKAVDPFHTFREWGSEADTRAYAKL